jgi:crossover junction endodeoxyribonuclease RuvC
MAHTALRVLGIDPGSLTTGYGCIVARGSRLQSIAHGTIRAGTSLVPIEQRLHTIHRELLRILAELRPDAVSLEEAFFGRNVKSALRIGEARGVALLTTADAGVRVFQYAPAVVKRSVVGNGNAHKSQIGEMVKTLLGLREEKIAHDATDALALAICHCHRATARLLGVR